MLGKPITPKEHEKAIRDRIKKIDREARLQNMIVRALSMPEIDDGDKPQRILGIDMFSLNGYVSGVADYLAVPPYLKEALDKWANEKGQIK